MRFGRKREKSFEAGETADQVLKVEDCREVPRRLTIFPSSPLPVFSQQEKALASFSPQWSLDR